MRTDRVHQIRIGGDVATHDPERLAQGSLDDVDLVSDAVAFRSGDILAVALKKALFNIEKRYLALCVNVPAAD